MEYAGLAALSALHINVSLDTHVKKNRIYMKKKKKCQSDVPVEYGGLAALSALTLALEHSPPPPPPPPLATSVIDGGRVIEIAAGASSRVRELDPTPSAEILVGVEKVKTLNKPFESQLLGCVGGRESSPPKLLIPPLPELSVAASVLSDSSAKPLKGTPHMCAMARRFGPEDRRLFLSMHMVVTRPMTSRAFILWRPKESRRASTRDDTVNADITAVSPCGSKSIISALRVCVCVCVCVCV